MQVSGATDLASKGQVLSDSSNARLKEEVEDSYQMDKIRCPCGSSLQADSMIKVILISYLSPLCAWLIVVRFTICIDILLLIPNEIQRLSQILFYQSITNYLMRTLDLFIDSKNPKNTEDTNMTPTPSNLLHHLIMSCVISDLLKKQYVLESLWVCISRSCLALGF